MSEQNMQDRRTFEANPRFAPPQPPAAPPVEWIRVGPLATDVIPRVWAEAMLTELRATRPNVWTSLLGHASAAPSE